MNTFLAGVGKWILTAIILPAIKAWLALQNKIREHNKKADENIKKAKDYEAGKPDTSFDDMP